MELMTVAFIAIAVSFAITFVASKIMIPLLKKAKAGQHVRDDGPESHLKKEGTPTMGGISILIGLIVASLILFSMNGDRAVNYALFLVLSTLGFALIGFLDDFLKLFKKRSLGLRAWQKIVLQLVVSALIAVYAYTALDIQTVLIPGAKTTWDLGAGFIPFTMFVLIAMVNSVNLTDGLDGLATSMTLSNAGAFLVIILVLFVPEIMMGTGILPELQNITVFTSALIGACVAFLFFNAHPAKVFMGDTGSFALGAALTVISIPLGLELLFIIMGFMFALSSISVIIQVGSYKTRKKRVFRMAPLHHHFELGGMKETQVVAMYVAITVVLSIVSILLTV